MLDTVGIGIHVDGLRVSSLLDREWTVHTESSKTESNLWASCEMGGVRMAYLAGIAWLGAETSLPSILGGDNSKLLGGSECQEALQMLRAVVSAGVGRELPELPAWRVSRFDPVWAWLHSPAPYIGALGLARLPRTESVRFGSSVRWVTRGNRVRARCYDKSQEQGRQVDLALRFERQVRRRERVRVGDDVIGRSVDDCLNEPTCMAILKDGLHALGLDRPIPSLQASRALLVGAYGRRRGRNAWAVLRDVIECGGVWPGDFSKRDRQRYESLFRGAGVSVVSPVGELPPLELPANCL